MGTERAATLNVGPESEASPRTLLPTEVVALADLSPHPQNPRNHDRNREGIIASLEDDDLVQNPVIASDNVLLGGHGVCEALLALGETHVRVHRRPYPSTDPRAVRLMLRLNLLSDPNLPGGPQDDQALLVRLLQDMNERYGLRGMAVDDARLAELLAAAEGPSPPDDFPEYDENIDVSGIRTATCPECGHEFPI